MTIEAAKCLLKSNLCIFAIDFSKKPMLIINAL